MGIVLTFIILKNKIKVKTHRSVPLSWGNPTFTSTDQPELHQQCSSLCLLHHAPNCLELLQQLASPEVVLCG